MPIYTQTTTNQGLSALANTFNAVKLTITRVAVGNGIQPSPATANALANEQIHSVILAGSVVTTVGNEEISVIISNTQVTTGFNITEIGIFGTSGTGPEQMLIYVTDSQPVPLPPFSSGTTNIYDYFGIGIANTNYVTVQVATGAYALQAQFVTHLGDPAAHPQAFLNPYNLSSTSKQGMIRALNGSISYYLAGDGTWQPIVPLITTFTNLFVDPSYNNIAPNFSSIGNAFNYLRGFNIASGVGVNIYVNAAIYNTPGTLNLDHLNGSQIQIIGTQNPDSSFSGVGSITGSQYNWSVMLTGVTNVASIKPGCYLNIWNANSSTSWGLNLTGCFRVLAVAGSNVTVYIPAKVTGWGAMGSVSGNISVITTVLSMGQNQYVIVGSHGLGAMYSIAIVAGVAPSTSIGLNGLVTVGAFYFNRVGVAGFIPGPGYRGAGEYPGFGFGANASGTMYLCCSSGNMHGITASGGCQVNTIWCAASHNTLYGLWAQGGNIGGTYDYVSPGGNAVTFSIGNGDLGILVNANAVLTGQAGWVNGVEVFGIFYSGFNGNYGCYVGEKSLTNASHPTADYIWAAFNTNGDLAVSGISVADLALAGTHQLSQPVGVFNLNGVINAQMI
jgi:hypothetical protein